jgi:arginine:pyruvate transaminase
MFVMLEVSAITADGGRFAQALLDVAGISTIPGVGFGATTRSYVRVSLTQPVEVLEEACDRINQTLPAIRSACA